MEGTSYDYFLGIDWASEKHDVCLISGEPKRLMEKDFANSVEGLQSLVQRLAAFSPGRPEKIAVAIEMPHGPVVETLVDQGFHVYAVNPKQLDRFRDRHTTAGAKDDRLDAFVLANSLRTDLPCFRRVKLAEADMLKLRELSRLNDELGVTLRRLSNQLLAQLMRFAPHLAKLCPAADKAWFWELLGMTIDPVAALKVKPYKVSKLLKSYRIRSLTGEEVYEAIKAPTMPVAPGVLEGATRHIKVLLAQLTVVHEQKKEVAAEIKVLLESLMVKPEGKEGEHRDAAIILSLPGIGNVVAATIARWQSF